LEITHWEFEQKDAENQERPENATGCKKYLTSVNYLETKTHELPQPLKGRPTTTIDTP